MNSYYEQKRKMSKGVKIVIFLFVISVLLTTVAVFLIQGKNPALKSEVEKLKIEKENKEKELKTVQENLEAKEKSYNELKSKLDKK